MFTKLSATLKPVQTPLFFADGHGELVKLQNLWTFYWHLNWNPALVKGP
jgi:hypothetical protein